MDNTKMSAPYFWQQAVWDDLQNQRQAAKLASAILIEAQAGLGLDELVHSFIQQYHCQSKATCENTCKSCRWLQAGSHPDHLKIAPIENKAIKVDEIRQIQTFARLTTSHSAVKTIWIQSANKMNIAAQNALLKILEEPPQGTFIFLSAHSQHGLLPTVLSRLYKLNIPIPPLAQSVPWCQQQGLAAPEAALALSQGAPLLALQRAQNTDESLSQDIITDFIHVGQQTADMCNVVEKWKGYEDLSEPLYLTYTWLMDLLWLALGAAETPKYHPGWAQELKGFVEKVYPQQMMALLAEWQKSRYAMLFTSGANSLLHLNALFIGWQQVVNGEYRVRD